MDEQNYKLVGYDCPLGNYPSPAVPIVYDSNNKHKAVYLEYQDDNLKVYIDSVVETASFFKLSDCDKNIREKLKKFDYRKHRLYALSKSNVDFYEIEDETYFFIKLLIDSNFAKDNPLTRVSLAEGTGIKDLLNRELQNYEHYLQEHKRNWLKFWEQEKNAFREKIQQAEDISKILDKIPVTGEKASEVGVNYTNLRNLLRDKKEDEADKETEKLIKKLNEKVIKEEIKCFPVIDLHTIDKLWLISSGGESGLSIKKMWGGREGIRPRLEGCGSDLINVVLRDFRTVGDFDDLVVVNDLKTGIQILNPVGDSGRRIRRSSLRSNFLVFSVFWGSVVTLTLLYLFQVSGILGGKKYLEAAEQCKEQLKEAEQCKEQFKRSDAVLA
ncbi:GUN4 domain-containing protein, partial [Nostoc cycadae]|uniref:GUN4 domain-containing protein n=1 Tax=Nostoc cycadae TaxID=246795 RepID=UPI0016518E04